MRLRGTYGFIFVNQTRTAGAQRSATTADITSTAASPARSAVAIRWRRSSPNIRTCADAPTRPSSTRPSQQAIWQRNIGLDRSGCVFAFNLLSNRLQMYSPGLRDVRTLEVVGDRSGRNALFLDEYRRLLFVVMKERQMAVYRI